MTDKKQSAGAPAPDAQVQGMADEEGLRAAAKDAIATSQAILTAQRDLAEDRVVQAVTADIATAPADRQGLSETSAALIACMAEVNEGHARSAAALTAVRAAIDGEDADLDAHQRSLEVQKARIDAALSALPENRAYLDQVGKTDIGELDEGGKRGLYVHLQRRLLDAVAEGYCKDKGVTSVDDLNDADRAELKRRQDETAKQW